MTGARDRVKPSVQQEPVLHAPYWLVGHDAGKGGRSRSGRPRTPRASEQFREQSQTRTAEASGATVMTERFEVFEQVQ